MADEVEELADDCGIGAAVAPGYLLQLVYDVRGMSQAALCPDVNLAVAVVSDVLDSALRADECVVALSVRSVVALNIASLGSVA